MTRWGVRLLMLMAIGAGPAIVNAAPITYDEAISGDLGAVSPHTEFLFDAGLNTISGDIHHFIELSSADFDEFLFTLPAGTQLVAITYAWTLHPFKGNEDAGTFAQLRPGGPSTPALASESIDLYAHAPPQVGMFAVAMPLGPGTYFIDHPGLGPTTACCGWSADYTWTFEVQGTAVPEPASLILLGSGVAALAARRRRRRPRR
jgi:hypothetical protein